MAPKPAPAPLTLWADAALAEIRALALRADRLGFPAATLMAERAALMGLPLPGRISAGGACRLIDCADGTIALNLPREDDWELVPALLEGIEAGGWAALERAAATRPADDLVARARLLGLAAARADLRPPPPARAAEVQRLGSARPPAAGAVPVVLDLTALWAGPLAAHLLERGGAQVIKVESPARTDGARRGNRAFYALLNQGKRCVTADLAAPAGRERILSLIAAADIVIESSRPRALRQFGIDAAALVAARPGLTWISITAHGRTGPEADWTGFGDDAGAAAGLCAALREGTGTLGFVGDAIADPLTGIAAAREAWRGWREGGGVLVSLALSTCAAMALQCDCSAFANSYPAMLARMHRIGFPPPVLRRPDRPFSAVGEHDGLPLTALLSC